MNPVDQFRRQAMLAMCVVMGALALPSSVVNTVQAFERRDPFLAGVAVIYFVCGVLLLLIRREAIRGREVRTPFLVTATTLVIGAVMLETPGGSSHMLGVVCMFLVLLGHIAADPRHRLWWHVIGSATFPAVLFIRQVFRPHPLLHDPLELVPQALAGGLAVFGLGLIVERLAHAFGEQASRARRAEEAKDQFLMNMSHELRTPLTAIIGYTEMLVEDELDDPDRALEDLGHIASSSTHLLRIIDDLLDLSRMDAVGHTLELSSVALSEILSEAATDVGPQLEANGDALDLPGTDVFVLADPVSLRRVFVNLLGNAAKFTQNGTVSVVVASGDPVVVEVRDTGEGFPPEMAERIFQPFAQADGSSTKRHGGTGLGLAISRRLVESMSGRLTAASRPGQGATFRLELRPARAS